MKDRTIKILTLSMLFLLSMLYLRHVFRDAVKLCDCMEIDSLYEDDWTQKEKP